MNKRLLNQANILIAHSRQIAKSLDYQAMAIRIGAGEKDAVVRSDVLRESRQYVESLQQLVILQILESEDLTKAASILNNWIEIVKNCLAENDYQSAIAILAAIESNPVQRLGIFSLLPKASVSAYQEMKTVATYASAGKWGDFLGKINGINDFTVHPGLINAKLERDLENVDTITDIQKQESYLKYFLTTIEITEEDIQRLQQLQAGAIEQTILDNLKIYKTLSADEQQKIIIALLALDLYQLSKWMKPYVINALFNRLHYETLSAHLVVDSTLLAQPSVTHEYFVLVKKFLPETMLADLEQFNNGQSHDVALMKRLLLALMHEKHRDWLSDRVFSRIREYLIFDANGVVAGFPEVADLSALFTTDELANIIRKMITKYVEDKCYERSLALKPKTATTLGKSVSTSAQVLPKASSESKLKKLGQSLPTLLKPIKSLSTVPSTTASTLSTDISLPASSTAPSTIAAEAMPVTEPSTLSGLPTAMQVYTFVGNKTGGAKGPGKLGGWYVFEKIKVLFKQESKKGKPKNAAVIAEVVGGSIAKYLMGDAAATVFFARADASLKEDHEGSNVYVGSVAVADYEADFWEYSYRAYIKHKYPDFEKRSNAEKQKILVQELPKNRPKIIWDDSHPIATAMRNFTTQDFAKMMVTALLLGDYDVHTGNILVTAPKGSRKKLVRIDFGWALYSLGDEIHPHSHARHLPGFGPTNHYRDFPRDLRITTAMADELERVATKVEEVPFRSTIDKSLAEAAQFYGCEPLRQFAQRLGIKHTQKLQNKEQIITEVQEYLHAKLKARARSLRIFAAEIRTDLAIDPLVDGRFVVNPEKLKAVNEEYKIQRLFDGNFHFRKKEHQGCNFIDRILKNTQRDLKNQLLSVIKQQYQIDFNVTNPTTLIEYYQVIALVSKVQDSAWNKKWQKRLEKRLTKNILRQLKEEDKNTRCLSILKLYKEVLGVSRQQKPYDCIEELNRFVFARFAADLKHAHAHKAEIMVEFFNILHLMKNMPEVAQAMISAFRSEFGSDALKRCQEIKLALTELKSLALQDYFGNRLIQQSMNGVSVSDDVLKSIIALENQYYDLKGDSQVLIQTLKQVNDLADVQKIMQTMVEHLRDKPERDIANIEQIFKDIRSEILRNAIIDLLKHKIAQGVHLSYNETEVAAFIAEVNQMFSLAEMINPEALGEKYIEFLSKALASDVVLLNDLQVAFKAAYVVHQLSAGKPLKLAAPEPLNLTSLSYAELGDLFVENRHRIEEVERYLRELQITQDYMLLHGLENDRKVSTEIENNKLLHFHLNTQLAEIAAAMQERAHQVKPQLDRIVLAQPTATKAVTVLPTAPLSHDFEPKIYVITKFRNNYQVLPAAPKTENRLPDLLHFTVASDAVTSHIPESKSQDQQALAALVKGMVDKAIQTYGDDIQLEGSGELLSLAQQYYASRKALAAKDSPAAATKPRTSAKLTPKKPGPPEAA